MVDIKIEKISNGFLVNFDYGFYRDSKDDFVEDQKIFAESLADAFALIANRCDQLMEDEVSKPPELADDQEEFSF